MKIKIIISIVTTLYLFVCSCNKDSADIKTHLIEEDQVLVKLIDRIYDDFNQADEIVFYEYDYEKELLGEITIVQFLNEINVKSEKLFNDTQTFAFRCMLSKMRGYPKQVRSFCSFEPHHNLDFKKEGKVIAQMRICYKCDEVEYSEVAGGVFVEFTPVLIEGFPEILRALGIGFNLNVLPQK